MIALWVEMIPKFPSFAASFGMNRLTAKPALDPFDVRLLGLLQEDATLSIAELAERIHLSPNACWKRVKRLEAEGVIRKRVALLDPGKLGAGVTVFVTVRAAEHSEAWLKDFAAAVIRLPEVVEFYRMSGDVDYMLKMQVADIAHYDAVYQKLIRSVRLSDVSSAFAMEEIKHTTCIPLPS
jgi:Lrp/AsnC family transcriptional regulator